MTTKRKHKKAYNTQTDAPGIWYCPLRGHRVTELECADYIARGEENCTESCELRAYRIQAPAKATPAKPKPLIPPEEIQPAPDPETVELAGRTVYVHRTRANVPPLLLDAPDGAVVGRICRLCKTPKPVTAFTRNNDCGGGIEGTCKHCKHPAARAAYYRHRHKHLKGGPKKPGPDPAARAAGSKRPASPADVSPQSPPVGAHDSAARPQATPRSTVFTELGAKLDAANEKMKPIKSTPIPVNYADQQDIDMPPMWHAIPAAELDQMLRDAEARGFRLGMNHAIATLCDDLFNKNKTKEAA